MAPITVGLMKGAHNNTCVIEETHHQEDFLAIEACQLPTYLLLNHHVWSIYLGVPISEIGHICIQ
jgi:hypothetical protein